MSTLLQAVKDHAIKNYDINGWDYIVEAFDDDDIIAEMDGATTVEDAIANVGKTANLLNERRQEIMAETF